MMQPLLLKKLANEASGIGRQSGFLARCLLAHPESAMGTRFYQEPPISREFMAEFEARITACLKQTEQLTRQGCHNIPTLSLSTEAKQKWMLQQILFFRELGFPLSDIQRIIECDDFNKIESLNTHKSLLQSSLEKTEKLIKTIDKTISHLRGKVIMRDAEMFDGFDPKKQQEHEKYMLDTGILTEQQIDESWQRTAHWKKQNWEQFKDEGEQINQDLAHAMKNHVPPDAKDVQALIQRHYSLDLNKGKLCGPCLNVP